MTEFEQLNETNSIIIEWEGLELRTTDYPYIDRSHFANKNTDTLYTALALDENDNMYRIFWEIINHENEAEACEWDNPIEVK